MSKVMKEFESWLDSMTKVFENADVGIFKMKDDLEYCEQCHEDLPQDHTCTTCCGDEITGWVEDYQICPTCKEHI